MAIDGPELYPPDATTLTPEVRDARNRAVAGVFLVTVGSGLLASRLLHMNLDYAGVAIGLAVLAGWNHYRRYGWFVVGAFFLGSGLGGLLDSLVGGGALGTALHLFGAAAGFFAMYVRYPTKSTWALIPTGICAAIGVGSLGLGLAGLIGAHLAGFLLPALLISAGVLLVARGSLPRKTRRIALFCIAGAFLLIASSSGFNPDFKPTSFNGPNFGPNFGPRLTAEQNLQLPSLEGKTLQLGSISGEIAITSGERASAIVTRTAQSFNQHEARRLLAAGAITVEEAGDRVVLQPGTPTGQYGASLKVDYRVTVPRGTNLIVETTSGEVRADVRGGDVRIHSISGEIRLTGSPSKVDLETTSSDIRLQESTAEVASPVSMRSISGDLYAQLAGQPDVDVTTISGDVEVDNDEPEGRSIHINGGDDVAAEFHTTSGDVEVTRGEPSPSRTTTTSSSIPSTTTSGG